jgi:hypothetical protein
MRVTRIVGWCAATLGIGACGASTSAQLQYELDLTTNRAGAAERARQRLEVVGERDGVDVGGVTIAETSSGLKVELALDVADCATFERLRVNVADVLANQRLTVHEVLAPEERDLEAVSAAVGDDGEVSLERRDGSGYLVVRPLKGQDLEARVVAAGTNERRLIVERYFKPEVPARELDYILVYVSAPKDELERGLVAGARLLPPSEEPQLIGLQLTEAGTRRFSELSQRLVGRNVAFLVDGRALSVPLIREPLTLSELPLSPPHAIGEKPSERRVRARELAAALATGPLADAVVMTREAGHCSR